MTDQVNFAADIKPLFRESDVDSMSWAFDLGSYDDVTANADLILERLQKGHHALRQGVAPRASGAVRTLDSDGQTALKISDREELIFLLSEASELEHGLCCCYLFAAFSLKRNPDEGLSATEHEAVARWDRVISGVAVQEMLHLALASNLFDGPRGGTAPAASEFPSAVALLPAVHAAYASAVR